MGSAEGVPSLRVSGEDRPAAGLQTMRRQGQGGEVAV